MRSRSHETHRSGNGADEFLHQRQRMVDRHLRARGLEDPRLLQAFLEVPREEFVSQHLRSETYADGPLPIGYGQTISQPFTVAFMADAAQLSGTDRVLEVGTGSGYGAAILSRLAQVVHTIERIPELAASARERLQRLGYTNVFVHTLDGTLGLIDEAPFDAIVITAGGNELPRPYLEQLAEGGRIVIPIGMSPTSQRMKRYTRRGETLDEEDLGPFAFVPLIGAHGWSDSSDHA